MNNTNHGFMIGRFYVPDEITVRASWMLPALTVPLAMVIHLLNGNSRDFPILSLRQIIQVSSDGCLP